MKKLSLGSLLLIVMFFCWSGGFAVAEEMNKNADGVVSEVPKDIGGNGGVWGSAVQNIQQLPTTPPSEQVQQNPPSQEVQAMPAVAEEDDFVEDVEEFAKDFKNDIKENPLRELFQFLSVLILLWILKLLFILYFFPTRLKLLPLWPCFKTLLWRLWSFMKASVDASRHFMQRYKEYSK